uniref:F-box domain-containing protein n=1 Tax=Oryza meridionalis TaxID=40149 RepID=A0A0E0D5B0_9ORYZ
MAAAPPPPPVNWLDLPADMLCAVFTTLEFSNLLRCGTVRATWLTTARALLRYGFYSHPETPCLLLPSPTRPPMPPPPSRAHPSVTDTSSALLFPSVIADARSELHLLNLITDDQILLLSVNPILKDDAGNNVTAYNVFFYDTNIPRK